MLLASKRSAQNRPVARAKGRLVDIELVGIDRSLHDVFAEPVDAGNKHDIAKAGFGIQREHDAAGGAIRAHHLHHAHRERDFEMVESVIDAIGDRAIGENGRKAAAAGFEQIVGAADIQKALVLAGKARRRKVFRGGRTSDGDGNISAVFRFELPIGAVDLFAQRAGRGRLVNDLARFRGPLGEDVDVPLIQVIEQLMQPLPRFGGRERIAIGIRNQRKAVGNAHALSGKRRVQLA